MKYGVIQGHKCFKGYTNVSENLNRREYFKILAGDKLIAKCFCLGKKISDMV